jgi:phosphoserine phosphatase RsbU/P
VLQEESDFARIRRIETLSPMPDEALWKLMRLSQAVSFAPGEAIVRQSDLGSTIFVLIAGDVEVVNESQHGRSTLARIAGPALIGEIAALARIPRTATVLAVTPVRAICFERELFLQLSRDAPEILISVIGRLGQNIQNVNRALGLYADSFSALEREDFDPTIIDDLNKPVMELRDFAAAFHRLAHHITLERRKRSELASAAVIQQAMLPQTLAGLDERARCDLFGEMKTAREVGGDLYDAVMLDENRLMLVIGDVCGKGVPASLFMATAMTVIRLAAREGRDVSATMEWVNAMLYAQNASSLFATVFYCVLDLDTGRLDYANCGHNAPFVLRRGGSCFQLTGGGLPLGIFPKRAVTANFIELNPGDSVFFYTDGITESIDSLGAEYGDTRLAEILGQTKGADAATLCRSVLTDVATFTQGVDQFDDITCLAVQFGEPGQSGHVLVAGD